MKRTVPRCFVVLLLLALTARTAGGQGLSVGGVGPINSAMGGAATAAPVDSSGALMWNPATLSGLDASEVSLGLTFGLPASEVRSSLPAGAFGSGMPATTMAGEDRSESAVVPIPNIGWVERRDGSPWTFGLGVFGIGGFRTNYPSSLTNPVLTPAPPVGFGVGRTAAEAEMTQILPTVSYALTERFSIGFAPSITLARISAKPLLLAAPDDANLDGFPSYPSGQGACTHWGGGFQVGVYYVTEASWHLGAALKSPQWFEPFRFRTTDELGRPRTERIAVEYPLVATVGAAYAGIDRLILAVDARFFDYGNAAAFGGSGWDSDGALKGLGWKSIFAVHTGMQYQVTESFYLRCGYSYNENPIGESDLAYNIGSPGITQHFATVGGTLRLSAHSHLSVAYVHGFRNRLSGPIQTILGPVPGSSVTSTVELDTVSVGLTVRY